MRSVLSKEDFPTLITVPRTMPKPILLPEASAPVCRKAKWRIRDPISGLEALASDRKVFPDKCKLPASRKGCRREGLAGPAVGPGSAGRAVSGAGRAVSAVAGVAQVASAGAVPKDTARRAIGVVDPSKALNSEVSGAATSRFAARHR